MRLLKFIWLFPSFIVYLTYSIYLLVQVMINSNIVELELLGGEGVAKEIVDKWIEPFSVKHKIPLRIFSTILWIGFLINIFNR
jgi:hypothetical protein